MEKVNHYKLAPTFLFNMEGETELFKTQKEVDEAWGNGWFGPPDLVDTSPLLSELDLGNKAEKIEAIREDPRYRGIRINGSMTTIEIDEAVIDFEKEHEVSDQVFGEE